MHRKSVTVPPGIRTYRISYTQVTGRFPTQCLIKNEDSGISVPGSRALVLQEGVPGNEAAFMIGREFSHIHPKPDNGSMHLVLASDDVDTIKNTGWGEDHYLVTQGQWPKGLVMIFSPRDEEELTVVKKIVARSYEFATGSEVSV